MEKIHQIFFSPLWWNVSCKRFPAYHVIFIVNEPFRGILLPPKYRMKFYWTRNVPKKGIPIASLLREKTEKKPLKKAHQLQREKISRFSATLTVLFTVGKNYFRLAVMRQSYRILVVRQKKKERKEWKYQKSEMEKNGVREIFRARNFRPSFYGRSSRENYAATSENAPFAACLLTTLKRRRQRIFYLIISLLQFRQMSQGGATHNTQQTKKLCVAYFCLLWNLIKSS